LSGIQSFFRQGGHYFTGNLLGMAAGFLSFPIFTRIFTVSEYGQLGLINTTLFFVVAFSKMGLTSSIVRFYPEYQSEDGGRGYFTSVFWGALLLAVAVSGGFLFVTRFLGDRFVAADFVDVLSLAAVLVLIGSMNDILLHFLRAQQRSRLFNVVGILRRYAGIVTSIAIVLILAGGLSGYFLGQIVAGVGTFLVLIFIVARDGMIGWTGFSGSVFAKSVRFGFPVVWAEIGHNFLNYADRYLIQMFLGSGLLGIYTAGYNLTTYMTQMLFVPVAYAITPIYMNLLEKEGVERTKDFFRQVFRYLNLAIWPMALGFIGIRQDFVVLLASEKYAEAVTIVPYVVLGQSVYALQFVLNSGLFIMKKTHIMGAAVLFACVLNVLLNMWLIPPLGIKGAAIATLITYCVHLLVVTHLAFREFRFRIEFGRIVRYVGAAVFMLGTIRLIDLGDPWSNLAAKVSVGSVVYLIAVVLLDGEVRRLLSAAASNLGGLLGEYGRNKAGR